MTAWYMPKPCYQLDGSPCASANCWACAGVVQLDAATGGAARITPSVFRLRAGGGSGSTSPGKRCASGFEVDVRDGLKAMGVRAVILKVPRSKAKEILSDPRSACFTIATDYELWPGPDKAAAPSFDGNHAVVVFPGADAKGEVAVANSLDRDMQRVDLDAVLDAATKFARDHARGRIIHMVRVFRPPVTAGALDKAEARIEELEGLLAQARDIVADLNAALEG